MWCWFHRASGNEHRGEVWQTGAAQFHHKNPKTNKEIGISVTFIGILIWSVIPGYYRRGILILLPTLGNSWFIPCISQRHTSAAQQETSRRRRVSSASPWTLQTKSRKWAFSNWLRHPAPLAGRHWALASLKFLQVLCRSMVPAHQSFHPSCDKLYPDGHKRPWIHYEAHDHGGNSHWEAPMPWMRNTRLVSRLHW